MIWNSCRHRPELAGLPVQAFDSGSSAWWNPRRPPSRKQMFLDLPWLKYFMLPIHTLLVYCWTTLWSSSNVQGGASVSEVTWSTQSVLANIFYDSGFIYWRGSCVWNVALGVQGQMCLACHCEGTPHFQGFEKDHKHWLPGWFWLLPLTLNYT